MIDEVLVATSYSDEIAMKNMNLYDKTSEKLKAEPPEETLLRILP